MRPGRHSDPAAIARQIVEHADGRVRLALPLGLGKANRIANALTQIALEDPSCELTVLTALTLQRPEAKSDLARRFLDPAADRLFGKYEPLLYATLMKERRLPANIQVSEFFFQAGHWLGSPLAQQSYIPTNYTHALQRILDSRPHAIAQLVAVDDAGRYSLSCNTDITADLLKARRDGDAAFMFACETNRQLPFMDGPAAITDGEIDLLLDDSETEFELFSVPRRPVGMADLAIGLHVSRIVPDRGTLQIGIGSIGDAVAQSLILRHRDGGRYSDLVAGNPFPFACSEDHRAPFADGLYAVTEMLVGGIVELYEADVIRREVDGAAIHAGFFVESRGFYEKLHAMDDKRRAAIRMMPVSYTNALYGDEEKKRAARTQARFVNNAMMATCLGEIASDRLDDGRVVSGVGGQFNFIAQAFELAGARSIITLNATRGSSGTTRSNICWSHDRITVPAHFRDIVVTEYGVADLRGRSDENCILAMIAIADSRFQDELLAKAKSVGKVARDRTLPAECRDNTPAAVETWLGPPRRSGTLPAFPFGTDFTETEQRLIPALDHIKQQSQSRVALAKLAVDGARVSDLSAEEERCLERLELAQPSGFQERIMASLVKGALARTRQDQTD